MISNAFPPLTFGLWAADTVLFPIYKWEKLSSGVQWQAQVTQTAKAWSGSCRPEVFWLNAVFLPQHPSEPARDPEKANAEGATTYLPCSLTLQLTIHQKSLIKFRITLPLSNECVFNSCTIFWDPNTIHDLIVDGNSLFSRYRTSEEKSSRMTEFSGFL